jgi:hypothetical protein
MWEVVVKKLEIESERRKTRMARVENKSGRIMVKYLVGWLGEMDEEKDRKSNGLSGGHGSTRKLSWEESWVCERQLVSSVRIDNLVDHR